MIHISKHQLPHALPYSNIRLHMFQKICTQHVGGNQLGDPGAAINPIAMACVEFLQGQARVDVRIHFGRTLEVTVTAPTPGAISSILAQRMPVTATTGSSGQVSEILMPC